MSTAAYVDLMFAWGYARLGDAARASELLQQAQDALVSGDRAHQWLLAAFTQRIGEAQKNLPHASALPAELIQQLVTIDDNRANNSSLRYVVDRFRELSSILSPSRGVDPYMTWKKHGSEFSSRLDSLHFSQETEEIERLYEQCVLRLDEQRQPENRLLLLGMTANRGPIIGRELLARVLAEALTVIHTYVRQPPTWNEAGIHFQHLMMSVFPIAAQTKSPFVAHVALDVLNWIRFGDHSVGLPYILRFLPELFGALYVMNLAEETASLLDAMAESCPVLHPNETLDVTGSLSLAFARVDWWIGQRELALRYFRQGQQYLRSSDPNLKPLQRVVVLCHLLNALGVGSIDQSSPLMLESIHLMSSVPNRFSTATHYSRLHLDVAEAAVLAVTTDDFSSVPELHQRLGAEELQHRREFLPVLREQIIAWGEKGWNR